MFPELAPNADLELCVVVVLESALINDEAPAGREAVLCFTWTP
jgi:hypothetical protein